MEPTDRRALRPLLVALDTLLVTLDAFERLPARRAEDPALREATRLARPALASLRAVLGRMAGQAPRAPRRRPRRTAPAAFVPSDPATPPLTPRQLATLGLVADGHPNREITRRLGLRTRMVTDKVRAILRLLGVADRSVAVAYAAHRGWLPDEVRP